MKKMLCVMFALVLILSLAISSALAASFGMTVHSQYKSDPLVSTPTEGWNSGSHSGKMYVYHQVETGVYPEFTNLFRGTRGSSYVGSKWCTVGQNIPIDSSGFVTNTTYGLAARGNTKHWEIDGITQFYLYGTYGWNQ